MKRVWKWPLLIVDEQVIELPLFSEVLTVESQNNHPVMYFAIDDEKLEPKVKKRVFIAGTGHPLDKLKDALYCGTVVTFNGELVWHVFMEDM